MTEQTTYGLIREDENDYGRYFSFVSEEPATSTFTEDHEAGGSRFLQSTGSTLTDYNLHISHRTKLQFINVTFSIEI